MKNLHYVVLDDPQRGKFKVVCLAHDMADDLTLKEAEALSDALNLESCRRQPEPTMSMFLNRADFEAARREAE